MGSGGKPSCFSIFALGDAHAVNKGDDLDKDSIAAHIQFCERKSRRTAVSYPWQIGFWLLIILEVYGYTQDVEQQSAPTYLRSFWSSLGFCFDVLGLSSAKAAIESPRIKGLATKCFLNKGKTKARWPLTVNELQALENIVCGHTDKSIVDRHVAGCFLFMVFARARFSDMMNVSKISFEIVEKEGDTCGYIESEVARSKTSFCVERKVRFLPMTTAVQGVGLEPWGVAWKRVIDEADIEVGTGKTTFAWPYTRRLAFSAAISRSWNSLFARPFAI